MATTTLEYKLYLYPEQPAAGSGFTCLAESYSSLAEAQKRGAAASSYATNYEIQCISTTVEPPSKRYPNGETSVSKTIVERRALRDPLWWRDWIRFRGAREGPPELHFNLGYGYLTLRLPSRADAMKVMVLLRSCGAGLFYNPRANNLIISKNLRSYSEVNKILKREGYCDPRAS